MNTELAFQVCFVFFPKECSTSFSSLFRVWHTRVVHILCSIWSDQKRNILLVELYVNEASIFWQEKVQYYDIATEKRAEFDRAMTEYNKKMVTNLSYSWLVNRLLFGQLLQFVFCYLAGKRRLWRKWRGVRVWRVKLSIRFLVYKASPVLFETTWGLYVVYPVVVKALICSCEYLSFFCL